MRLACRHEPTLALALRQGRWPSVLAAHVEGCPSCREAARVAGRLQSMAQRSEGAALPPDPAGVWSRASLAREVARRRELVHRAARPALWFQRVAAILAAGATAAWIGTGRGDFGRVATALVGADPGALLAPDLHRSLGDWPLTLLMSMLLLAVYLWGRATLGRLGRP